MIFLRSFDIPQVSTLILRNGATLCHDGRFRMRPSAVNVQVFRTLGKAQAAAKMFASKTGKPVKVKAV
jgi:hypothetical protein